MRFRLPTIAISRLMAVGSTVLARYDVGEIEEPGDETSEDWALRRLIMHILFGRSED